MLKHLLAVAVLVSLTACTNSRYRSTTEQAALNDPLYPAIRSASDLNFSSERSGALKNLAATSGISEPAQLYLIETAFRQDMYSSELADVLTTLANNPSCSRFAQSDMAQRLRYVSMFDADRIRVVQALREAAQRTPPPTATTIESPNK